MKILKNIIAVLAILSAIAIPSFVSINDKAKASAAANTLAQIAKECAVQDANNVSSPLFAEINLSGYTYTPTGRSCAGTSSIITFTSDATAKYPTFWPLAVGKVTFHGEPVALVIARDKYVAEDASELVLVDYEELPVVLDPEEALSSDSTVVHEKDGTNEIFSMTFTGGETEEEQKLNEKELIVICDVGAYGMSLSSNYNLRLKPAEVLINGSKVKIINKRQTLRDIV